MTSTADPRLPGLNVFPPSIILYTPSGHAEHYLSPFRPDSKRLAAVLDRSRAARAKSLGDEYPEDIVERALNNGQLQHVTDGPLGGIWLLEKGKEEVVCALVEELEEVRRKRERGGAGWRVLGVGIKGSEGRVYLIHPCGRGAPEEEVEGKNQGQGRRDNGLRAGLAARGNRAERKMGLRGLMNRVLS